MTPAAVVVGGGVAGSAVAIHLARLGRRVLLLDRASFPRRKACGEGLFPRGVRALRDLGVFEGLEEMVVLETLRFEGYGYRAEARLGSADAPAIGVRRDVLDAALLEKARESGVEVREGCTARLVSRPDGRFDVVDGRERVEAGVVVAADGLGSGFRTAAGVSTRGPGRRFGVSAHLEVRQEPTPAVQVFFRHGYEVYLTPVGRRCLNVAVLMSRPLSKSLAGDPALALKRFLEREEALSAGWQILDAPLAAGPFPVRPRRMWKGNLVLAGDAAGFFDGITGEGMSLALASAPYCASAVDAYLSTGDDAAFRTYASQRRALGRASEMLGRVTLAVAAHEWTARRAISGLGRRQAAFSRLVAVGGGEARVRDLRPLDLLAPLLG